MNLSVSMNLDDIRELITRRRRQVLVHSIIYYELDDCIVADSQWADWALELERLQAEYPDIAAECPYAEEFKNFEHSTGHNLPMDDPWGLRKGRQLIAWRDARLKGEN